MKSDGNLKYINTTCDPSDYEETCLPTYTGLICSIESLKCVCPTDFLLTGGNSESRKINMEWVEEVAECQGSPDSACDSAGNGPGPVTCIPGYLCIQSPCERLGNGACMEIITDPDQKYDTTSFCSKALSCKENGIIGPVLIIVSIMIILFGQ